MGRVVVDSSMREIRLIAAQGVERGSFGRQYGYGIEDNREKVLARRQLQFQGTGKMGDSEDYSTVLYYERRNNCWALLRTMPASPAQLPISRARTSTLHPTLN